MRIHFMIETTEHFFMLNAVNIIKINNLNSAVYLKKNELQKI